MTRGKACLTASDAAKYHADLVAELELELMALEKEAGAHPA